MARQEVFWKEHIPIRESNTPARINTFFITEVSRNPYAVKKDAKPVSVRDITTFVLDNRTHKTPFGDKNDDIMQSETYQPWQFEGLSNATDIPDGLYEWINSGQITIENIRERIAEIQGKGGLNNIVSLEDYLRKIKGREVKMSKDNFAIDITSLYSDFHIEGETDDEDEDIFRNSIRIVGQYNEVRDTGDKESIIRIRKVKGMPGLKDAINLTMNKFAYKAKLASNGVELYEPNLMVFNLTDGKLYRLDSYNIFDKELLNLMFFSYLSKKAGYIPEKKLEGIIEINLEHDKPKGKCITVSHGKKKKQTYSAEEAFQKAEKIISSMQGESQYKSPHFFFPEIKN